MKRKPKFLLALAIAILTFASLNAFVPKEYQDKHCCHKEHCTNDHQSKNER